MSSRNRTRRTTPIVCTLHVNLDDGNFVIRRYETCEQADFGLETIHHELEEAYREGWGRIRVTDYSIVTAA